MVYHLAIQFYVSIESILYGVVRHDYLFVLLFFTIGLLLIKKLVIGYKKLNKTRIYVVSILSILFQWIILHLFGALPLDETRHMLVILPLITIVIFYAFKDINFKRYSLLAILVISTATYSASIYSVNLIESKYSNFDYNLLNARDEKVILLALGELITMAGHVVPQSFLKRGAGPGGRWTAGARRARAAIRRPRRWCW